MQMIEALKVGQSLKNPEFYKKLQSGLTLLFGAIPLIGTFIPSVSEFFTAERMGDLLGFVAAVNLYFIPATSEKVGI